MDEKKLLDQIRESASDLTPPGSLNPDAIEKLLTQKEKPARKKFFTFYRLAGAAAVFALCAVSLWQIQKIQKSDNAPKQDKIISREANAEIISVLPAAQSYEEIYSALRERFFYDDVAVDADMQVVTSSAAPADISGAADVTAGISADDAAADGGSAEANFAGVPELAEEEYEEEAAAAEEVSDYSKTNIQESGVDEADIVKTDGKYLYILRRNGSVTIIDAADPENLKEASTIPPADSDLYGTNELYIDGDILNVIATRQSTSLMQDGDVYYPASALQTILYTYNISDRTAPKLSGTVTQDGYYETSRKNGSFIYLFTSWHPDIRASYQESLIIPTVNGEDLKPADFYIPESLTDPSYLLISSIDIEKPQNILDRKALVSGTSNFYVSPENIYIANENWNSDTTMTDIMKFHYEDGMITGAAAGSVKGYLNNSFSLNEYNGSLRVVSTYYDDNYEEQNGLYILDKDLHITGSIEDLAGGETIRSARFFGDIGYFVTFRQTDPLFSADLSNPASPVILGELKVSGFSSYLHFYGEDLLLGMGYEANEQTGAISGVKLSMFDVSDPADVTELHRLVIPGVTWCPSIENYKSILIDPQKNIFGFFCDERYLVFSYDRKQGFVSELVYDFIQDSLSEQTQTPEEISAKDTASASLGETDAGLPVSSEASMEDIAMSFPEFEIITGNSSSISADNTRGLYIGDTFYLAGDVSVISFDMKNDYSRLGKLSLA